MYIFKIEANFQFQSKKYRGFKGWVSLHYKNNDVVLVIDEQSHWAGHSSRSITVLVVDDDGKIVSRNDLLDQNVCTIFLEAVILSIECNIMRISPAGTHTCTHDTKMILTAAVLKSEKFVHLNLHLHS